MGKRSHCIALIYIKLNLELPPLPTLTLSLEVVIPFNIPSNPSLSMPFSERTSYCTMNNPFHGLIFKKLSKTHQKELNDALESVRGPFLFDPVKPFTFDSI